MALDTLGFFGFEDGLAEGTEGPASSSSDDEYAALSALVGRELDGADGGRPNFRVRGGGGDNEDRS